MTPLEQTLYAMTRFKMEDEVEIAGELIGTVTGIQVTTSGEDTYRVFYFDNAENPKEEWIRDSMLSEVDDEESNVIPFPVSRTRH
jgi:hypothetical protein